MNVQLIENTAGMHFSPQALSFLKQSKAPNTLRSYQSDWDHFETWCRQHNSLSLPASVETVVNYISDIAATAKCSTIQRRLSSISQAHQAANFETPTLTYPVRTVFAGIRRSQGAAQNAKTPLLVEHLAAIMTKIPHSVAGTRDKAILLLGFAGAFRRSELAALECNDIEFEPLGMRVTIRRSKTDQESIGRTIGIPYGKHPETCPVLAVQAWMQLVGKTGPLFRAVSRSSSIRRGSMCDRTIALVIKSYVSTIGLNPEEFSGQSLRAGLATSAARAGVNEASIMRQTGHKGTAMVRRYIRNHDLFHGNAAQMVGL